MLTVEIPVPHNFLFCFSLKQDGFTAMSSKTSTANRGTAVESAQQLAAAEFHRHLPSADVVGTFYHGRRIGTPSGKPMCPSRPCSAAAAYRRGVSTGAEESRSRRDALLEKMALTRPTHRLIADVQAWLMVAQAALSKPAAADELKISGSDATVLPLLSDHHLRAAWRAEYLRSGWHRQSYPFVGVAVQDVAHRGPLDRLSTLLHAVAQFKLLCEKGSPPQWHAPFTHKTLCADAGLGVFGSNVRASTIATPTGGNVVHDVEVGSDFHSRHVALAVGTHFYALDIIGPDKAPLAASEIRQRIIAAVDHAEATPHCHEFLGTVSRLSRATNALWAEHQRALHDACLANRLSMQALDKSLLCVTLVGSDTPHDLTVPLIDWGEGAAWTGCGTQIAMFPSGDCAIRCNAMHVDMDTLIVFSQWISSAANTDPLLAPREPKSCQEVVTAVKRVPLSSVRPSTAQKGAKGAAPTELSADAILEETASVVNVAPPVAEQTKMVCPLPLWLPVQFRGTVEATDTQQPYAVRSMTLSQCASESVIALATLVACDAILRQTDDAMPPLVRFAQLSAKGCPREVTLFDSCIRGAIKLLTQSLRTSTNTPLVDTRAALAAALSTIEGMRRGITSAPLDPLSSYLPIAKRLSKAGHIPGRPTLRTRGECCAAADVVITTSPVIPTQAGLSWIVAGNITGVQDTRFSLCVAEGQAPQEFLCSYVYRASDATVAGLLGDATRAAVMSINKILA